MRKAEGITLVALVVTIVVMLVLVAISINIAFGDDGIFGIAKQAANKTTEQSDYEANELSKEMATFIDGAVSGVKNNTLINPTTPPENVIPTLASKVTANNYGNTVTYTSPNGISEWKIFYNDGTNVYIIASDYVENSKIALTDLGMVTNGAYSVYWSDLPNTSLTVGKWMLSGNNTFAKTQNGYYATAGLMNTSKWSGFVDETYADSAIAGPTLDMYIESWNAKYPSDKLYLLADSTGYYVGTNSNPTSTFVQMSGTNGYSDTLYYPHPEKWNLCNGYWLSSPSANTTNAINIVHYDGKVIYGNYNDAKNTGIRPIVCLKSTIDGTLTGNNWILEE